MLKSVVTVNRMLLHIASRSRLRLRNYNSPKLACIRRYYCVATRVRTSKFSNKANKFNLYQFKKYHSQKSSTEEWNSSQRPANEIIEFRINHVRMQTWVVHNLIIIKIIIKSYNIICYINISCGACIQKASHETASYFRSAEILALDWAERWIILVLTQTKQSRGSCHRKATITLQFSAILCAVQ